MKCRLVRADGREAVIDHVPIDKTLIVVEHDRELVFRQTGWTYGVKERGEPVAVGATFVEVVRSP